MKGHNNNEEEDAGGRGKAGEAESTRMRKQWSPEDVDDLGRGGRRGRHPNGLKIVGATGLKFVRVFLLVVWQLCGYLFEAGMVVLTLVPAMMDVSRCLVAACFATDRGDAAVDFPLTSAYGRWLSETTMIAFETEDGRKQRKKVKKAEKMQRKRLFEKIVTNGLLESAKGKSLDIGKLGSESSLAFVITDIQGSTQAQLQNPRGYQQVVLKHDMVMREALYSHNGHELDTEGDSFRLVFAEVVDAIKFCVEAQENLLSEKWPNGALRMASFKQEHDAEGQLIFAGPRVRMGVHLALPGTFDVHHNLVTKKPVISGYSWNVANKLGEIGNGGQIVISDTAWSALQHDLAKVAFPAVKHMGAYALDDLPEVAMDIFEVVANQSDMLKRTFGPLRRCRMLARPQTNFGVTKPPQGEVALVGVRASQYDSLVSQPSLTSFRVDHKSKSKQRLVQVSTANNEVLVQTIRVVAHQFQGFLFTKEIECDENCFIAFTSVADACRFAIALQAALLCADWPDDPQAEFVGQKMIYRGPTVAVAIHVGNTENAEFFEVFTGAYEGTAVCGVSSLLDLTNIGQIVLSFPAWHKVQFALGELAQPFVIDLGVHTVEDLGAQVQLVEILARELKGRVFPDVSSVDCVAPGARQSPISGDGVAFVFTSPVVSQDSQDSQESLVEEAISVFSEITRQAINAKDKSSGLFFGYECQEVGAGNFLLAFRDLEMAMKYAGQVQETLLSWNWPADLLRMEKDFGEVRDDSNRVVHRGLRVKMGIGYGYPYYSMPHPTTGRADYFGPIVNAVARVKEVAKPGQILVLLKSKEDKKRMKTDAIIKRYENKGFELTKLGKHELRGVGRCALAELAPEHRRLGLGDVGHHTTLDVKKMVMEKTKTAGTRALNYLEAAENYILK
ncbi:adenylate cyclase [Chloropicon primus]|nr:adenylate cyclase [Chloropicon primus]